MGKWNFAATNSQLIADLNNEGEGDVVPRTYSFKDPSIEMVFINKANKIKFYESGNYRFAVPFTQIGEIGNVVPTSLENAKDLLLNLILNSNSGASYNTPTVYDTVADLPITFDENTIHSISILSKTGTTTITVDGEETTLSEGQEYFNEATTLIDVKIYIDSCTGTFIATTLN